MSLLIHCKYTTVFNIRNTFCKNFYATFAYSGTGDTAGCHKCRIVNMKRGNRIVIATDSFKGSMSSAEAGKAIADGILDVMPDAETEIVPVGDGGEGTAEALCAAMSGKMIRTDVSGPLGRPVSAAYCITGDGAAVMEMSQASGLTLIGREERNPMLTSTCGTGMMVMDAGRRGCRTFLIGVGGSATNDAGMGMLTALGYRFMDRNGNQLPGCGASLERVADVDDSGVPDWLKDCKFHVACDVDTPFCGPEGASFVFAGQKGADPEMTSRLDRGMESFADMVESRFGIRLHDMSGSGAAGGLGGAFKAFLGADLKPGIELVLDTLHFDSLIRGCSLVITGEGRMDSQTVKGKAPYGVMKRAAAQRIPAIAFCGQLKAGSVLVNAGFSRIYEVDAHGMPPEEAMTAENACRNLRDTVRRAFASIISRPQTL